MAQRDTFLPVESAMVHSMSASGPRNSRTNDVMVISCARLIRIDFSAAGTLLNWATARQAEGRQVQFVEVHRLVAAFFNVIGIAEHARVIARSD